MLYVERPELEQMIRNEKESILLIGAPGIGKTTELQRYYLSICMKTVSNLSKGQVPIFIPARSIDPNIDFLSDTLRLNFERNSEIPNKRDYEITEKLLEKCLKAGRIVLFVDGLDEVMTENRKKIAHILFRFHQEWPNNKLIVSSRTYTSEEEILRLKKLQIPDLSLEERKRFYEAYEQYRRKT